MKTNQDFIKPATYSIETRIEYSYRLFDEREAQKIMEDYILDNKISETVFFEKFIPHLYSKAIFLVKETKA